MEVRESLKQDNYFGWWEWRENKLFEVEKARHKVNWVGGDGVIISDGKIIMDNIRKVRVNGELEEIIRKAYEKWEIVTETA